MFEDYCFDWFGKIFSNCWGVLVGILTAIIGYMLPVKNIVHLMLFFFFLDILFGYWAAKKLRKEHFSVKIIWRHTMPRVLISIILVISSYMWDTVFNQEFVSSYKLLAWFICGILIFSIAKNSYKVTKWEVIPLIGNIINKKITEQTGVSMQEANQSANEKV